MSQINPLSGNATVKSLNVKNNLLIKGNLSLSDPIIGTWIGVTPVLPPQYITLIVSPAGIIQSSSVNGSVNFGYGYWQILSPGHYSARLTVMEPPIRIVNDVTISLSNNIITGNYTVNIYDINDFTLSSLISSQPPNTFTLYKFHPN